MSVYRISGRVLLFASLAVIAMTTPALAAATCTPTGFVKDSINLTAALINPKGPVSGDVDATGCNIGIYYGPKSNGYIHGANIHGANYYGIVNNGGNVHIFESTISDIGERPLNGSQHGVAVYFAFGSASQGEINGNVVWNYQKGGIVVNGTKDNVDISHNTVVGQGPVNYIAQNGIQIGYGANAHAHENMVVGNSYTGSGLTASGGIIVVGGACYGGGFTVGSQVENNILIGNDVGVWFSNLDVSCSPAATPTRNVASQNTITDNAVNNTTGNGATQGYQAGISDQGDGDVMMFNNICGLGYTGGISPAAALYTVDVTLTNSPNVKKNTICSDSGAVGGEGPHFATLAAPLQRILASIVQ